MNKFKDFKYRRYKDCCYKMIQSKEGFDTFAWKKVDTVLNIVYKLLSKQNNLNMFLLSIQVKDVHRFVTEHMLKMKDNTFPDLEKDRHVFSFENGIYIAKYWENDKWCDKFFKYGDPNIPGGITSCKYFDIPLNYTDEMDPNNIQTPLLDKILTYQNLPSEVIEWNKAYLGRLLYENNELDNWQTIMFYLGQGGTGKSTINNDIAKQFYEPDDVAIMSNNIQRKFGLSDIYDKLLFIAPEIKKDWCIEQAEFQEIVSGGDLNINIKYKQSETKKWSTPGLLGGNENPDFIDNSGSVKRRIVVTRFDKKVVNGDCMLAKKLKKELPDIIKQCNLFYQQKVRIVGDDVIWNHLPEYFRETQAKMTEATNSLSNFMNSGKLVFANEKYMPKSIFVEMYNNHCRENNFKASRVTIDFLNSYFEEFNIVQKSGIYRYDGKNLRGQFFMGVDVVVEEEYGKPF